MAGEKLSQEQRNANARAKFLEDDEARAKRLSGMKFKDGVTSIDGLDEKQVSQAYQGDYFGKDDLERYNKLMGINDNDSNANDNPSSSQSSNGSTGGKGSINSPISQANPIDIKGDSNQVNQDNSISQTIDNSVDNTDNSQRYYGGSSRTFNYKGGDGESSLYDTPVSKATMAGFYDTDDSPAAATKFMDMYIDSNRLAQRGNRKEYDKYKNVDYSANDPGRDSELNAQLNQSIEASRKRASSKRDKILMGRNPFDINFTLPGMPSPIESKADDIYKDTLEKIK